MIGRWTFRASLKFVGALEVSDGGFLRAIAMMSRQIWSL